MHRVTKTRDTGQAVTKNVVYLTAVKVDFPDVRPNRKLKLTITLNNETYTVDIGKDDPVQWSGSVRCSVPSTVLVCIYRRRRLSGILTSSEWKEVAFVQAPVSLDLRPITDPKRCMTVTFTVSEHGKADTHSGNVAQSTSNLNIPSRIKTAKEKVEKQTVVLDKLDKIRSVIDIVKSAGEALSDIHPAIGAATSALGILIKAFEKQESCRDKALELIEQFETFLSVEFHVQELKQRAETRRAVEAMLNLIQETSEYICNRTSSSIIGNLFGDEYQKMLTETQARFTRAKGAFDRSIQLEVFKSIVGIERTTQLELLRKKLSECEDAHFRSGTENICLDGTRVDLRERVVAWMNEVAETQCRLFWLRGKAGSGKSTVANTVAQMVEVRQYHLSCFFCRQDSENLSDPRRILPTLAYRFAQQHESYRAIIFHLLDTDTRGAGIADTAGIDIQFDRLFKEPLAQTVDPLRPHIVIVDALDECGTSREQTSLAGCMLALSSLVPWIKVFVTSRDEPAIRNVLATSMCVQCDINEEKGTDDDIRRYITSQAYRLEIELSTEDVGRLVRRAEGLFIWCSTLFKYFSKSHVPTEALKPFLSGKERRGSWANLYQLYDRVLDSAAEIDEDVLFMRVVLAIVNVAASNRPLSAKAIVSFLHGEGLHRGRGEVHVQIVVKKLHAVLYVDKSMNSAIRAYHSSFYDFLEQKATGATTGWEGLEAVHGRLFRNCIRILKEQLRFNICGIKIPILNKNVHNLIERLSERMSEELQYSSCFWFTHLSPSDDATKTSAADDVLAILCSKRLLYWLESLSLQGALAQSLLAFWVCMRYFQKSHPTIAAAANDARRFVTAFSEAMDSIPHIYLSALLWLPQNSEMYRNLELSRLKQLQIIKKQRNDWDVVVRERSVGQALYSTAYSPDGQYIASGTEKGHIYIWDARTGEMEGEPLQGHISIVFSLAYSPSGNFIASGSRDHTVQIWNVKLGEPCFGPLRGHTDSVNCVAYSTCGEYLASGSDDATVRIWSTRTGSPMGGPLRGHDGRVGAVAYSPNGLNIASGGEDCNIRIWSTVTYEKIGQPFRGHSKTVTSVRYSPDGRNIISGSYDFTVCIWDARTGQAIRELRGHTDWVRSVMYSPSGRFILSSSDDWTIRVWDAASGMPVGDPLRGHSNWVWSAAYSPDGLFIASASRDTTICIWDAPALSRAPEQHQAHGGAVLTVAYSVGGHHIATGSADASIRRWDAETGAPIGEPLRGHKGAVQSTVYSPDGRLIVSGSEDCTVRIWDARTGAIMGKLPGGHSEKVLSLACSPDGRLMASVSHGGTICLWDARRGSIIGEPMQVGHFIWSVSFSSDGCSLACGTRNGGILVWDTSRGMSVQKILRGHSRGVRSVAFCPNGRYIASGSDDGTVRIWDAQTGRPWGSPLVGHESGCLCVAYSLDGCLIASGSFDETIRIWDAWTGLPFGNPLRGHSDWIRSVAFSPDGRSLASVGDDKRIYVHNVPNADPSLTEAERHRLSCCSGINEQGWVRDGETLLLWIPALYRSLLRRGACLLISELTVIAARVDAETLFRYSGEDWENVFL